MPEKLTVDMVTEDPNTGELVLYFVEDGPWPEDPGQLATLLKRIQDKIFDAAEAAVEGSVAAVFPEFVGRGIRIQIDSPHGCPEELERLVTNVGKLLAEAHEYATAIKNSKFISGLRVVTGHMMGRFKG